MSPEVERVFLSYPEEIRDELYALRKLILETASSTEGVGPITETLKWGEPAYLTERTQSGSTIRLGWKADAPSRYAMYVHCQTSLVEQFRSVCPELSYDGNRAVVFDRSKRLPRAKVAMCIELALTYHRRRKRSG